MRNHVFTLAFGMALLVGTAAAVAQDDAQHLAARQQRQAMHGPQSMDQELAHLTKDLQLTPAQQQQVKPLLQEHHDKIQALLDKNPTLSRQDLSPQIHAISDETHHEIHALLNDHQKQLETEMVRRMHRGDEQRRPMPSSTTSP